METPNFIKKIDWIDLRSQKTSLLATIDYLEKNKVPFIPEHLTGILHLIDALQDYAVDEMGVPEIHVFDFELEEEREQSTPFENFARESAQNIFNELCESDGFHQEDDVPSEFIESVMANDMNADIIRAKIHAQILNDLKENPEAFKYDSKNVPIYDSGMREDYESLATQYIREIYLTDDTVKTVLLCSNCGSDNVETKAWVNPNTDDVGDTISSEDEDCYCNDCAGHHYLLSQELKIDAKVVGFQVVGEEGTKTEGEIHPDMDGSFCLYSLKQAREMLNDKHNHSSVHDDNWKLLTIWSGDVEEPTFMFEGDPRDEDFGTTDGHIDPMNR